MGKECIHDGWSQLQMAGMFILQAKRAAECYKSRESTNWEKTGGDIKKQEVQGRKRKTEIQIPQISYSGQH